MVIFTCLVLSMRLPGANLQDDRLRHPALQVCDLLQTQCWPRTQHWYGGVWVATAVCQQRAQQMPT